MKHRIKQRSLSGLFRFAVSSLAAFVLSLTTACGRAAAVPAGSVVINEAMSANTAFAVAGDGKYYDWVELHNTSEDTVDLDGCYITDNEEAPRKFWLRGLSIPSGGYALVYLSGLDGVDAEGYLHAGFGLSSKGGETLLLSGSRGELLDRLDMPESQKNISYGRVPGSDSFAWFSAPTPLAGNSGSHSEKPEELVYEHNNVIINEFMTENTLTLADADGDFGDWVELYNPDDSEADMSGYSLSDSEKSPSEWVFPQGTSIPAHGYLLVFCDGKDITDAHGTLHTDFSLSTDDDGILLFSDQGILCDSVNMRDIPADISCGLPSGSSELKLFSRPTPGSENPASGAGLTSRPQPDINSGVLISEVLSVSGKFADFDSDYIEIFNSTEADVSLGGYTISQTPGEPLFRFPEMTLAAGGYAVVWCDGRDASRAGEELHAAIKINSSGEDFYLAEPDGRICDRFASGKGTAGVSSGRLGGDTSKRYFFTVPTPGKANSGEYRLGYAPMPVIGLPGGYTEAGTAVSITVPEGCEAVYTTDGSKPSADSKRYTAPLTIDKTTVLRTSAVKDGCLMSQCAAETYFVEEKHSIPVVSLSSDPAGLFGSVGIYTNFRSGGEREVHCEYYDESGVKCVEFDCGAKLFGQYSLSKKQKGFRLALRETYGQNEVTYPFFPDSNAGVTSFSNLLLRPCGQDQGRAKLRDELIPAIVRGRMDLDIMDFRACAVYINGKYWGLYYIRNRQDADWLERRYGFEEGSFDLVKSQFYAQSGTMDAWKSLENYCSTHDLAVKENYEYVCSQVDIDSLINFWICETYFTNTDTGNIRCYKAADGKWRWMLYDMDWAMTQSTWQNDYIYRHLLDPNGHGAGDMFSNVVIRRLLENPDFRDRFISAYCYHINTTFETKRVSAILDSMAEVIRDEIPRQHKRWGYPSERIWKDEVAFLHRFLEEKPAMAADRLQKDFSLSDAEMKRYLAENK